LVYPEGSAEKMNMQVAEDQFQSLSTPIASLGETDRRILSYAAAMGKEFDFSILFAAVGMEEEKLAEVLEDLVHRGVLKEYPGGDVYAFARQDMMVQAYLSISSSRMRVIHRKVAETYEKLNPEPGPEVIPEMGRHFHLGQMPEKSLLYNRYAAFLATRAFSPDVAIQYLERVLEDLHALSGDHRVEEADVLKEIGDACLTMGDFQRADGFYERSLAKIPQEETTLRALVLLSRADATREMDQLKLTQKYCGEAVQLLQGSGHRKGLAIAHRILGRTACEKGEFELARTEIELTLSLFDPEKDTWDIARCYIDLGNAHSGLDNRTDRDLAIEYFRKAIKALEPFHDYQELSRVHNCLAVDLGPDKPREAIQELKEARACAERGKDMHLLGWSYFNGIEYLLAVGDYEQAVHDNEEARRILSKLNDPMGMQQIAMNQGILAHYHKSYEEAEKAYNESLRQAGDLGYSSEMAELHIRLCNLYMDWGRPEEAKKELASAGAVGTDKLIPQVIRMFEALKRRLGVPG
jgi:tetratricopeptide (TPR) repeat protein